MTEQRDTDGAITYAGPPNAGLPSTVRISEATLARLAARDALSQQAADGSREGFPLSDPSLPAPGSRCEVAPGGRRGTVRFAGCAGGIPRPLIAVELDMPQGDDTQRGGCWIDCVEYFKPSNPDAAIVWKAPKDVVIGDFPEEDPFAGLSDSEDESATKSEVRTIAPAAPAA
eukprot:gnl/TRDRNA2_/TRDRNA2_112769_c0_seq1.p1 gnl/TRDRNA2_/TRDRNA2_112769_c0~~gnl/TRDRNA2_/TRDRNA2_112769_c0_seq1.p1  ORF type:complete len:172 (-),score=26.60 gnl/TRDRNA2_/TRDRNA2_112769_c0_seq1:68-583(-)